jgi:hypothetical protein
MAARSFTAGPIAYDVRRHPARVVLAVAYAMAGVGIVVMAFDSILYNRWATVVLEGVGLVALALVLVTGRALLWLFVGAVWLYAGVVASTRGIDLEERAGLALIFFALAFGALAAYVAESRGVLVRD